jgi:hypothetical protein
MPECRACDRIEAAKVTGTNSAWKRRKQFQLGGVVYEITTHEFGALYRAEWVCEQCREAGAWAPISSTPEQAIDLAEIGLRVHHTLVHGEPHRTPK